MKKMLRPFLLLALCWTILPSVLSAQANAIIIGPSTLCFGECATYEVVLLDSNDLILFSAWQLANGVSLQGNPVTVCMDEPNGFPLSVSGFTESQSDFFAETFVEASSIANPVIISTSAQCPDSLSACDKICAFNTAVYEVTNVPPGTSATWQVFGAQNFTPNGNSVTVEWGGPGQGQVSVVVGGTTNNIEPLQIFCGMLGFSSNLPPSGSGDGYLNIYGGKSPYNVVLLGPNGTATNYTTDTDLSFPNLIPGNYTVEVTDATGASVDCQFLIAASDNECWTTVTPVEIVHPSSCFNCDGFIQVLPGSGSGFLYTYQWSNGATGNAIDGLCPGTYSVTLTDVVGCTHSVNIQLVCPSSANCVGESSLCVEILEEPKAAIAATPPVINGVIQICQGQTVYFKNESQNASSYIWDFGNLKTSTQFEPKHTYPIPGTYNVSLIARNDCYCSDTTFVEVYVLPADVPRIECVGTVCEGESVTYSTDANCGTYTWGISGGGTILDGGGPGDNFVTVEWNSGPEGTISLAVSGCAGVVCTTPNVVPIPIISESAQIQGRTNVCQGSTEEYFLPNYQGTEIIWKVIGSGNIVDGQGTERVNVLWFGNVNQGNPQKVTVTFNNCYLGCEGKDTLDVNIVPSFYLKGPIQVCEKTVEQYTAHNSITNAPVMCDWVVMNAAGGVVATTLAATSTNVDWNLPIGTYTVQARPTIPTAYCNDKYEVFVKITAAPPPPASIDGEDEICPGEVYPYQANGLPINDFNWTVTGGTPASFKGNPVNITWGPAPPYSIAVTQTATTGLGCTSAPVSMNLTTIPAFTVTGNAMVCMEETGTYSVPFFEKINYGWTISPADRGTIISGQGSTSVEVLWHEAGPATLSVNVCGAVQNYAVTVLALPNPQVIHPVAICKGTTANAQTTVAFSSYKWVNDGGIQISTAATPDLAPGYYTVEVIDQNGCEGSSTFTIFELPEPVVSVSVPIYGGLCPGGPSVTITASTTANGYDFQWFDGGSPVGTNSPFLTVSVPGSYSVEVTDQNGCTNTSNTLIIQDCDSAGGTCVNGVCVGPSCNNPNGCTLNGAISFDIQKTGDCLTHNYINTSVNDVPGTWFWNFDDLASGPNNASGLENPSHTFSSVGFYSVIFTGDVLAVGGGSCPDGMLQQDTIIAVADFEFVTACPGSAVAFTDVSEILPFATLTGWSWNFGDPGSGALNTSTDQNPTHIYQTGGTYTVTLTITEMSGCQTTATKNVTIYDPPVVSFAQPAISCENTALPFVGNISPDVIDLTWNFGDPASGAANTATKLNTHHGFGAVGVYPVTLTATNIYGCSTTFTDNVTVTPNTLGGNITYSQPSPICEGDNITLTAPAGGITYQWSTLQPVDQITVSTAGVYEVTLTDAEGCTYSPPGAPVDIFGEPNGIIQAVEYNEFGQPVAFFENSYTVCEGEDVYLTILGSLDYSYAWSDGNTGEEISFTEDRGNLLSVGVHNFAVTVTDNTNGCTSEEGPFTVTVNPKPDVQISSVPTGFLCENNPATLSVVGPNASLNYSWNTGETGNSIMVIAGGTYFAQAVNQFGCKSRSNEITIHNAPDIDNIPTGCHTRCDPDTMCLPNMPNVASYQWYFNGTLMPAPNGTQAEPIFTQSGEYRVQMVDIYGCKSASGILTLDLLPGFGDLLGNVYYDVNQNGIIDGPDTLVSGIDIFLNNGTVNIDTVTSNGGSYAFPDILSTNYEVILDTFSLPPGWTAYYINGNVEMIGCDIEEQFDWLVVNLCAPETFTETLYACPGGGTTFDGTFIPTGNTETFTYQSVSTGCDSIITVTVDPFVTVVTQEELGACTGTTVTYEGVNLNPGDMQEFTLTDVNGCDSTVQVTVIEWPGYNIPLVLEVCQNSSIIYNGTPLFPGDQQDFPFVSENGCDSIMSVSVEGFLADTTQLPLNACPGSTTTYQGVDLAPGDQQDFAFTDISGCDSVVQVSVDAWPTYTVPLTLMSCQNASVIYNGTALFPGDQQDFVLPTVNGCDSTIQVTVEAIPTDTTQQALNACPGSTTIYQGVNLAPGDQQDFTLTGTDGCDSVVQVSVGAWPTYTMPLALSSCENSSIQYNGQTLFPGTQQDVVLMTVNGCDSVMQVTVAAIPIDTIAVPLQVCEGETINYNGQQLSAGEQIFISLTSTQTGCDSVVDVSVTSYPIVTYDLLAGEICWNGTDGEIAVQNVQGGAAPYLVSLDGNNYQPALTFENLPAGDYTVFLLDDNDCQYEETVEIPMIPQMTVVTTDETMECGDVVNLAPAVVSQLPVTWQWPDGGTSPTYTVTNPGIYPFSVTNACETISESITVGLEAVGLDGMIYMPNSFSPNNDGMNDCYKGYVAPDLEIASYVLKIFDRWGNLMFETNDINGCWDGVFKGKQMQPAVFAWFMELHVLNCDGAMLEVFEEGDIHLVR